MQFDKHSEIEVNYDGGTEIDLRVNETEKTISPTEAHGIVAYVQSEYPVMMAAENSKLASIMADLEIAADRAERVLQQRVQST